MSQIKAQKTLSHLSFRASHSDTHKADVIGLVKCHRGFAKVSLHPILYWRMEIHGKNQEWIETQQTTDIENTKPGCLGFGRNRTSPALGTSSAGKKTPKLTGLQKAQNWLVVLTPPKNISQSKSIKFIWLNMGASSQTWKTIRSYEVVQLPSSNST